MSEGMVPRPRAQPDAWMRHQLEVTPMFKKILLPLPPSQVSSLSGRSRLRLQPQPLSSPLRLLLLSASLLRREPPRDHPRLGRLFLRVRLSHRLSRLPGLQLADPGSPSRLTLGPIEGCCLIPQGGNPSLSLGPSPTKPAGSTIARRPLSNDCRQGSKAYECRPSPNARRRRRLSAAPSSSRHGIPLKRPGRAKPSRCSRSSGVPA